MSDNPEHCPECGATIYSANEEGARYNCKSYYARRKNQLFRSPKCELLQLKWLTKTLHCVLNDLLCFVDADLRSKGYTALAASKKIWPEAPLTVAFADKVFEKMKV